LATTDLDEAVPFNPDLDVSVQRVQSRAWLRIEAESVHDNAFRALNVATAA
jgi:hypothetical protein